MGKGARQASKAINRSPLLANRLSDAQAEAWVRGYSCDESHLIESLRASVLVYVHELSG